MRKIIIPIYIIIIFIVYLSSYRVKSNIMYGNEIVPDDDAIIENFVNYNPTSFTDYYFYNLSNNYGYNAKGSCGYIAIGMLLSYYDSFLSDYFIDEIYDKQVNLGGSISINALNVSSPGILMFEDNSLNSISNIDYFDNYINNADYYDYYFQYYLLHNYNQYYNYNNTSINPASLSATEVEAILDDYISNNSHISPYVTVNHLTNVAMNDLCNLVSNDIPVLALITRTVNNDSYSHAVICYDYQTEPIYHWGISNLTHAKPSTSSVTINHIYYLTTTLTHSCSNNYYNNNTNYCSCDFCNSIYHTHNYSYGTYNNLNHELVCNTSCLVEGHSFRYNDYNASFHRTLCDCGYNQLQQHAIASGATGLTRCLFCHRLVNVGITPFEGDYIIIELENFDDCEPEINFNLLVTITLLNNSNNEEDKHYEI